MTELLRRAFKRASELPPDQQDALASTLIQELEAEQNWDTTLAESQDELSALADAALDEHRDNRTKPLDPDEL